MEEFNLMTLLERVNAVKQSYAHLLEFDKAVMSNVTSQMQTQFSKVRLELGLLKAYFLNKYPGAPARELQLLIRIIDTLMLDFAKQESQYWLALALIYVNYGTDSSGT